MYMGIGSYASLQRGQPDSTMKLRWLVCNGSSTPSKKRTIPVASQHQNSNTGISKEEAFFDSQAWLESDDEDFFSVNDEQTPSISTSPPHQKKSLSDLFCGSFDNRSSRGSHPSSFETKKHNDDDNDAKPTCFEEASSSAASELQRRKSAFWAQRCLPALIRSLSCSERKKSSVDDST